MDDERKQFLHASLLMTKFRLDTLIFNDVWLSPQLWGGGGGREWTVGNEGAENYEMPLNSFVTFIYIRLYFLSFLGLFLEVLSVKLIFGIWRFVDWVQLSPLCF